MRYRTEIDISEAQLGQVEEIVEKVREYGYPELTKDHELIIVFEVGPDGIMDLWELRSICEELEAFLSSYISAPHIDKPVVVEAENSRATVSQQRAGETVDEYHERIAKHPDYSGPSARKSKK